MKWLPTFLRFFFGFILYRSRKVTTDMGEKFEVRTTKFFNWCWSGNDGDDVCKLSNALKCNPPLSKKKNILIVLRTFYVGF